MDKKKQKKKCHRAKNFEKIFEITRRFLSNGDGRQTFEIAKEVLK